MDPEPAGYVIFADICHLLNLPSQEAIVGQCNTDLNARGMLLDLKIPGATGTPAWVKYGLSVTMGEAHTQDMVWNIFHDDPGVRVARVYQAFQVNRVGYIVMEYINVVKCEKADMERVAAAVKCLTGIRSPTMAPGPVGGGSIKHQFFVDWDSEVTYRTVELLEDHINNILMGHKVGAERVCFKDEVRSDGLLLCPSDISSGNFMKDEQGKIVALDFGATCFLPRSFFAFTLMMIPDTFGTRVAKYLDPPQTTNMKAMSLAFYFLVVMGSNKRCEPPSLFVASELRSRVDRSSGRNGGSAVMRALRDKSWLGNYLTSEVADFLKRSSLWTQVNLLHIMLLSPPRAFSPTVNSPARNSVAPSQQSTLNPGGSQDNLLGASISITPPVRLVLVRLTNICVYGRCTTNPTDVLCNKCNYCSA